MGDTRSLVLSCTARNKMPAPVTMASTSCEIMTPRMAGAKSDGRTRSMRPDSSVNRNRPSSTFSAQATNSPDVLRGMKQKKISNSAKRNI